MLKIDAKKYLKILEFFAANKSNSTSQLFQDLFVLYFCQFKKKGYFVDIGAADGFSYNNTFILERKGWKGIVSEPLEVWHKKLKKRNCIKDFRCVYDKSNLNLSFSHVKDSPMLSGVSDDFLKDENHELRKNIITKKINTISLNDLLIENKSPKDIDYISVDTEGSENKILQSFSFEKFNVEIFTIEHNFVKEKRENIAEIMQKNGYVRIFVNLSGQDDWFLKSDNKVLKDISI